MEIPLKNYKLPEMLNLQVAPAFLNQSLAVRIMIFSSAKQVKNIIVIYFLIIASILYS